MRPPRPGSLGDKALKGSLGATVGMASGSLLTTVIAAPIIAIGWGLNKLFGD